MSELHKHGKGEWEPLSFSDEILYLLPLLNQLGFLPEWLSALMFFMLQWCDRVNHHLCVDHQFYIHCERKTSSSALFKIVVSSCLCFLMYKDKSPDKKLALQMEVKALVLFCWEFVKVCILFHLKVFSSNPSCCFFSFLPSLKQTVLDALVLLVTSIAY